MEKKVRNVVLLLALYVLIFIVGFRAGEIYNRMKRGFKAEKVVVPISDIYYVVEDRDYGTYRYTDFRECGSGDPLIQFLYNENLKPILGEKKLRIYKSSGDRIY